MDLIETARALLKRIDALLENPEAKRASALPDGGYFLDENTVLCLERANGDARFPYTADGFNLWAHSSGYISINESTFYVVLSADGGKEPYLNFYAGLPADGGYVPVSLTGAARSPLEGETGALYRVHPAGGLLSHPHRGSRFRGSRVRDAGKDRAFFAGGLGQNGYRAVPCGIFQLFSHARGCGVLRDAVVPPMQSHTLGLRVLQRRGSRPQYPPRQLRRAHPHG